MRAELRAFCCCFSDVWRGWYGGRDIVNGLPPVFDEGMAAVKQLSASNQALQGLLKRLSEEMEAMREEVAKSKSEMMELRERVEEADDRHTTSIQVQRLLAAACLARACVLAVMLRTLPGSERGSEQGMRVKCDRV